MKRYEYLDELIAEAKPQHIIEIGVHEGMRALAMIRKALQFREPIFYTGYDVFEGETQAFHDDVLNGKGIPSQARAWERVNTPKGCRPMFAVGRTQKTLHGRSPQFCDFAFIDGDHRADVIVDDFKSIRAPMIVLDDFYVPDDEGRCVDVSLFGANKLVGLLNPARYRILPQRDRTRHGGFAQFVVVRGHV